MMKTDGWQVRLLYVHPMVEFIGPILNCGYESSRTSLGGVFWRVSVNNNCTIIICNKIVKNAYNLI